MLDIADRKLMRHYTEQFGWILHRAPKYLTGILARYVENGCTATRVDYARFIVEVAVEYDVKPASVRGTIERFVKASWRRDELFQWEWEHYTGWTEPTPPTTAVAIRLICESYVPFVTKYEEVIQNARAFYFRAEVEAYDKGEWKPYHKL